MRIFLRLTRVACFPALAPVSLCRGLLAPGVGLFSRALRGSHVFPPSAPVSCCQWFGFRCVRVYLRLALVAFLPFIPHVITFGLIRKQGIYTAPSGNELLRDLFLFSNMILFQVDSLKEICEETLRKDIDNDTVLLCLGVAEQFSVSRLKVRTI